jgi:hypothetical protein
VQWKFKKKASRNLKTVVTFFGGPLIKSTKADVEPLSNTDVFHAGLAGVGILDLNMVLLYQLSGQPSNIL